MAVTNKLLMKGIMVLLLVIMSVAGVAQRSAADTTTKGILLKQLKETHDKEEWFVPLHQAIQDLTPAQAKWKPDDSTHSIVQLVSHLIFWNARGLNLFKGVHDAPFKGSNDETFSNLGVSEWTAIVHRSDSLSAAWEQAISSLSGPLSAEQRDIVTHMSIHNAYHTGQIMYARKQERAWDSKNGVH